MGFGQIICQGSIICSLYIFTEAVLVPNLTSLLIVFSIIYIVKPEHHYKVAKGLVYLLENRFKILGFSFGLDPIIGFVPWIGDAISTILALYLVVLARKMDVEQKHINKMLVNIAFDFLLGLVPVIGDVSDFFFRSNTKNLRIIEKHGKLNVIEGEIR
jgi:hypothetical protein